MNIERLRPAKCVVRLTYLASGEEIAISQGLGEPATGSRLDTSALAPAGLGATRALQAGVELIIVNKFGRQEAQGEGYGRLIAEALASGVLVVLGASRLNLAACVAFPGG